MLMMGNVSDKSAYDSKIGEGMRGTARDKSQEEYLHFPCSSLCQRDEIVDDLQIIIGYEDAQTSECPGKTGVCQEGHGEEV